MLDWALTLSLVFGGCCSNAITLQQLTSINPKSGSLITVSQFLVVSLYGLPHHLMWTSSGPRLKPRTVPLSLYLVQVGLFYLISLFNNAAFGYGIPMSVHIIFRSGGLIVSMLLGVLVGKKYALMQVASVFLVTTGVAFTTLSASASARSSNIFAFSQLPDTSAYVYAKGIGILSQALLLSGLLGLVQDWTYSVYGRPSLSPSNKSDGTTNGGARTVPPTKPSSTWQESMFYLHFLSLPMFFFSRNDISSQLRAIHSSSSPKHSLTLPGYPFMPKTSVHIPTVYIPLLANTLTQLVCVAGVNRLTTRMSALTVTLVLVVRKAVSLMLSVVGNGIVVRYAARAMGDPHFRAKKMEVDARMMWAGAILVMLGTIGYSLGNTRKQTSMKKGKQQ